MDNKMFRAFALAFRILFCLGIISNIHVNGQGDALLKVHEDCRLHELCPVNCVRCDTVPQCYDMSDEFGCGHGMDVFHKLFPGPPIPTGTTLDKLKETLWVEKVAYIREQLQKSLNNNVTVKTGQMLFKADSNTGPSSDKTNFEYQSQTVKPAAQPTRYTEYKDSYKSVTSTPSYTRFKPNPSRTDSLTKSQNIPSIYSPKADASPLINWLGASQGRPTSPEKGKSRQETVKSDRVAGVAIPVQPVPYPDPEPPATSDVIMKQVFAAVSPTVPDVMPPIDIPSPKRQPEPMQYQEPSTATNKTIGTEPRTVTIDKESIKERIVVFQPEPLPETGATVSMPKVTRKPDTVVAAIDSVFSSLLEPQNAPLSRNSLNGQVPTLSLSEVPMSAGAIPSLSQNTVNNHQANLENVRANTASSSDVNTVYQDQEPMGIFQDKSLPSIPMLPGLLPQIQPAPTVTANDSEPIIDYKVGDFFMALPPETKTSDSLTAAEKQDVLIKSKPLKGIPVAITDQPFDVAQKNQANDNVNTWSFNQRETQANKGASNLQNMAFKQTAVDRQDKERVSPGIGQNYMESSSTTANSYDQTGSIDLLSLLFPGLKESASKSPGQNPRLNTQETNLGIGNTPETMPDIVPVTRTTPDSTSVTVPVSKGDNGNGCDRVQDYTAFCSTRTHGYFKNNFDCASYIVCDWGKMHVCRCPQSTMFDPELGVCNWITEVDCY